MFNIKRVRELERMLKVATEKNEAAENLLKSYEVALRDNLRLSTFISERCYFRNKKGQIQKCK
ncbi:MAG: hypothetical protein ACOYMA_12250 [Bacteroidia bacterium]